MTLQTNVYTLHQFFNENQETQQEIFKHIVKRVAPNYETSTPNAVDSRKFPLKFWVALDGSNAIKFYYELSGSDIPTKILINYKMSFKQFKKQLQYQLV